MDIERKRKIDRIATEAIQLPSAQQTAFVRQACNADDELAQAVGRLLMYAQQFETGAEPTFSPAVDPQLNRIIGHYQIISQLDQGGMSIVYQAVRQDEFRQQVAIKFIKRGLGTDDLINRFLNERKILARLQHENIVPIFDGGTTDDGLLYFVMEYIEGQPIDEYCDAQKLSVPDRLALFRQVCEAVQHAHRSLVIHCDLKPSNIFVTTSGQPKLLDFGIAKILDPDLFEQTVAVTQTQHRPLTPGYASPEQWEGKALTTSSDVYSLGVILYQLLTGHHPYGETAEQNVRVNFEREPSRPSVAVTHIQRRTTRHNETKEISPQTIAHDRNDEPKKLQRRLRGDLDNIVLKALRKDVTERYTSVEQLTSDIQNYLTGKPVLATKGTRRYRLQKFVRRHQTEVWMAVIAVALLFAFAGFSFRQARLANQAKVAAEKERDKAKKMGEFLASILTYANPSTENKAQITLVEVMLASGQRIEQEFKDYPQIRLDLHRIFGQALGLRGNFQAAAYYVTKELELGRELNRDNSGEWVVNLFHAAGAAPVPIQAERLYREALSIVRAESKKHPTWEHPILVWLLSELGELLCQQGRFEEGESMLRESLEKFPRLQPKDAGGAAFTLERIAMMYQLSGEVEQARLLHQQFLEKMRGINSPRYIVTGLAELGRLEYSQGNYAEAEKLLAESLPLFQEYLGEDYPQIASVLELLALIHAQQRLFDKAQAEMQLAIEIAKKRFPPQHPQIFGCLGTMTKVLFLAGQRQQAEPYMKEALALYQASKNQFPPSAATGVLGGSLTLLKRYPQAEALLMEAYNGLKPIRGERSPDLTLVKKNLVELYKAWGKPKQAAQFR